MFYNCQSAFHTCHLTQSSQYPSPGSSKISYLTERSPAQQSHLPDISLADSPKTCLPVCLLSWWCTFSKFGWKYKWHVSAIIVSEYPTEYFYKPNNPLYSAYSFLTLGNHWSFYCLHSFIFSECHVFGMIQYINFSDWLISLSNML